MYNISLFCGKERVSLYNNYQVAVDMELKERNKYDILLYEYARKLAHARIQAFANLDSNIKKYLCYLFYRILEYYKFPHTVAILLFSERLILLELLRLLLPLLLEMPITGVLLYLARCPRLSCKLQWEYSDRQNIRGHFRLSIGYILLYRASLLYRKPYFHINHMILV